MAHCLIEIPRAEWPTLRDLYTAQKLISTGYNMLQNFISWVAQNPSMNVKMYALDGAWLQDGTFILDDSAVYYFNTLSKNQARLVQALNCLDTSSNYLLCGFPDILMPAVQQHLQHAAISKDDYKSDDTVWFHLPKEQAINFTIDNPAGITLARLQPAHAKHLDDLWPHRTPTSVEFVERLIRYNDSVGAFTEQGQLVAWCLRHPCGSLGLLQVEDTHKRQGLASLLIRHLSKLLAQKDEEVLAPVVLKNEPSRRLFEKLGFQIIDQVHWFMVSPKKAA